MKRLAIFILCGAVIYGSWQNLRPVWREVAASFGEKPPTSTQPRKHILIYPGVTPQEGIETKGPTDFNRPETFLRGWGSYRDPGLDEVAAQREETARALVAAEYEALDAQAEGFRQTKARYASGMWKLFGFYQSFTLSPVVPADEWQTRQARLKQWCTAHPQSITARIALAEFLNAYAWQARGGGWASEVSPEAWTLFGKRLADAFAVLAEGRELKTKDPHWWFIAQTILRGRGLERSLYERLFEEAIAFEPDYHHFYEEKATFLLPRWDGEPGEWERFAAEAAAGPGGDALYARIVSTQAGYYPRFFQENDVSWERVRSGYTDLFARYPKSVKLRSECLRLARLANDRAFASEVLAQIGEQLDPRLWKDWQEYVSLRTWAQSKPSAQR